MKIINLVEDTKSDNGFENEHGLSFYIETPLHKLLFDCGQSDMLLRNAKKADVDLKKVDTVILSHGHYDHSGGILPFAKINDSATLYAQKAVFGDYYNLYDSEKYIGIDKGILDFKNLVTVDDSFKIDDELFLFSNIRGNRFLAKGNLYLKKKIDGAFLQDDFIHEQCLVLSCEGKKILFSGCAHNGIVNILDRYFEIFKSMPDVVIGGFHLMQKDDYSEDDIINIEKIAYELLKTNAIFYTGHCTGESACKILKNKMGDKLQILSSGAVVFV